MKLTKKLFSFLHRVFDKDPAPFLALRLRYAGVGMTWSISDARLTTIPIGGIGAPLSIDLTRYSLVQLISHLAEQPGYTVEYADRSDLAQLGAAVLLDGAGDQNKSNGDHLRGYTNVLWSYMEANARELQDAGYQIDQMLLQMSTKTASDFWLDELGGYYGVPRMPAEQDASYRLRIIAEVLRPRGNNVAIEAAISAYTGQMTRVTDVVLNSQLKPLFNGEDNFNGEQLYNSVSLPVYGLFDVEYGYDIINGGDFSEFKQVIQDLINRLRDAGTHLRSVALKGSVLIDTLDDPADMTTMPIAIGSDFSDTHGGGVDSCSVGLMLDPLSDINDSGADGMNFALTTRHAYDSIRRFDGQISYRGFSSTTEATV